jgi:HAD superfamily hydrolase (TIGR01490 family)
LIAALFDCDGTLFSGQFGRGLLKYASEHGHKGAIRTFYGSLMAPYTLRKIKLVSAEWFSRRLMASLARVIKGWNEEEVQAAFEWIVEEWFIPTQQEEVIARYRSHQEQGHLIVLVSAQFLLVLEMYGQRMNAFGMIGTKLEIKEGRYTGKIIPPVTTGKDKSQGAVAIFASRGMEIDWDASFAYADSFNDKEMLNLAGHPVAVYPDAQLHALAMANYWEIIGTPKS